MTVQTKSRRSLPLTLLLGYFTAANAWIVLSGAMNWYNIVSHGKRNPEIPLITAAAGLVMLVLFVFVWLWKRWAVYALAVLGVVNLAAYAWLSGPSWILLISVVLVAALAWFIRAQWPSFR